MELLPESEPDTGSDKSKQWAARRLADLRASGFDVDAAGARQDAERAAEDEVHDDQLAKNLAANERQAAVTKKGVAEVRAELEQANEMPTWSQTQMRNKAQELGREIMDDGSAEGGRQDG